MRREYKLAAQPIKKGRPITWRRVIHEITYDGHEQVFAIVLDADAHEVLEAIRRAYQDGREDNAAMLEAEGRLITEPLTHVPMVCTTCRTPVERVPGRGGWKWEHESEDAWSECPLGFNDPVRAMVAAGNETVPRSEEKR